MNSLVLFRRYGKSIEIRMAGECRSSMTLFYPTMHMQCTLYICTGCNIIHAYNRRVCYCKWITGMHAISIVHMSRILACADNYGKFILHICRGNVGHNSPHFQCTCWKVWLVLLLRHLSGIWRILGGFISDFCVTHQWPQTPWSPLWTAASNSSINKILILFHFHMVFSYALDLYNVFLWSYSTLPLAVKTNAMSTFYIDYSQGR